MLNDRMNGFGNKTLFLWKLFLLLLWSIKAAVQTTNYYLKQIHVPSISSWTRMIFCPLKVSTSPSGEVVSVRLMNSLLPEEVFFSETGLSTASLIKVLSNSTRWRFILWSRGMNSLWWEGLALNLCSIELMIVQACVKFQDFSKKKK